MQRREGDLERLKLNVKEYVKTNVKTNVIDEHYNNKHVLWAAAGPGAPASEGLVHAERVT